MTVNSYMLWVRGLLLRHATRQLLTSITRGKTTLSKKYMPKVLDFHAGPLVWIDCEMTGLDARRHKIIEIAVGHTPHSLLLILTVPGRCSSQMGTSRSLTRASNS